jgi:hypothetical protein
VRGRHRLHAGLDIIGGGELGEDSPRYREEVTSTTLLPMELAIGIFTGNTMEHEYTKLRIEIKKNKYNS